ncbi:hypothetical protein HanRHA438_Chr03g0109341 [Helianthus annuus]|nr:hypothetical protein HanRHA438_Chr03g0109341 [Helianthus annuus]
MVFSCLNLRVRCRGTSRASPYQVKTTCFIILSYRTILHVFFFFF